MEKMTLLSTLDSNTQVRSFTSKDWVTDALDCEHSDDIIMKSNYQSEQVDYNACYEAADLFLEMAGIYLSSGEPSRKTKHIPYPKKTLCSKGSASENQSITTKYSKGLIAKLTLNCSMQTLY